MSEAFNPDLAGSSPAARTINFLRTRTNAQWLAVVVWWMLLLTIIWSDWKQGKHVLAAIELVTYVIIFAGSVYLARAQGRRDMKFF